MPELVIKVDTRGVTQALSAFQDQVPFATAVAVNNVARTVREQERTAMGEVFAHPRPFTRNSVFLASATKGVPVATVFIRPDAAKYLLPYEKGGVHELPGKALLNPKNVRLDAYGQLRKGQVKTLAEKPGNFAGTVRGITGIWQRPLRGQRRRGDYGTKGKLHDGAGFKTGLKLLVRLGGALEVKKHLGFVDRATSIADKALPDAIEGALEKTIATMNRKR